jgi:hypothetical protein
MYTAVAYALLKISSCRAAVANHRSAASGGGTAIAGTHNMRLHAQVVKLLLVRLPALGRVVGHEQYALALAPEQFEDVSRTIDQVVSIPEHTIAVEHPVVVFFQEFGIVGSGCQALSGHYCMFQESMLLKQVRLIGRNQAPRRDVARQII